MKVLVQFICYIKSFLGNIAFLVIILLYGSFSCIFFVFCPASKREPLGFFLASSWSKACLFLLGIRLSVSGSENIHPQSLYIFNHKSQVDIPILVVAVPISLRFGAKKEYFKIPFLGWFAKFFGTLPIERGNREEVMKVYAKALSSLKNKKISFALASEGGRFTDEGIGPFKTGPFMFAMSGGLPIVPVVISGADRVLKKGSLFANWGVMSATVKVKILPAIQTQGYSFETRAELKEKARSAMMRAYEDLSLQ